MTVLLEIRDGDPWWLSPDIWTVPGSDPEGPIGSPIVGSTCFVWARVRNNGKTAVEDAEVRFYWANPSIGFDRSSANMIGTSYVSLDSGEAQDVLCLAPWVPIYVNEGHECVLAEAFHPSQDPLPATSDFNVPTDRHVAQLNLSVLTTMKSMFRLSFEVHNNWRKARAFKVIARQASIREVIERSPWIAKMYKIPKNEVRVQKIGFTREHCLGSDEVRDLVQQPTVELKVGPHSREGLTLVGTVEEKGASLVHVQQWANGYMIGGLSAVVISEGGK